ncbi:MAG: DUF2007 domain-containing protein [Prevotella sp.]|jgi:predicted RNA-binding Zn-ribbon protein involved in translation (DUF1610 family)
MEKKFLMKSDTTIFTNEVVSQLEASGIASEVVDETKGAAFGYGPNVGMSIYVDEKDYERAKAIVDPLMEQRKQTKIWCPKCGSEDVVPITPTKHSSTAKYIMATIFILIGVLYFCFAYAFKDGLDVEYRTVTLDVIAGILIVFGFLLFFFGGNSNDNYHCKHCGKDFFHQ